MKLFLYIFLILTFIGPLWIALSGQIDFHVDYRTANRDSAHLAPDPKTDKEAVVQVFAAKAFHWRGLFSVHTWIATKPENAESYTIYQIVGWRLLWGRPALSIEQGIPDRNWFDQKPQIILDIRGEKAQALIPAIDQAAKAYPYPQHYVTWPGPNSNTFTAYVARAVPELGLTLPPNALGKDFLPSPFFARAASNTGYQFSLYGLLGLTLAKREGLELNILGLVYGVSPAARAVDLPGIGQISLSK